MAGIIKSAMRSGEDDEEVGAESETLPVDAAAAEEEPAPADVSAAPAKPKAGDGAAQGKQPQYKTRVIEAIPENLRDAFSRVILAGQAVLYSKGMVPEVKKMMERDVPAWQKLAEGIALLMKMLDLQSNRTMPQELLIPAGIELIAEFGAFLQETQALDVTDDDMQQAITYIAVAIPKLYGAKDEDIQAMFQQAAGGQAGAPAPAPEQEA